MGKHGQLVMGPAGSGKSTYCASIKKHCDSIGRTVHIVNLDPAAEYFDYPVSIDIRDLISLTDVMAELDYGPNGGLIYCMEYFLNNIDWLIDQLDDYSEDYLVFDLPGQIELYTHLPIIPALIKHLHRSNYSICAVYLLDSMYITDSNRFISGALMCLSAMISMELPHINILSKCDMITDKSIIQKYLDADADSLLSDLNQSIGINRYNSLNRAISNLLTEYSLVSFLPLDLTDEESIGLVLAQIDNSIQYGEDEEVKEPKDQSIDIAETEGALDD